MLHARIHIKISYTVWQHFVYICFSVVAVVLFSLLHLLLHLTRRRCGFCFQMIFAKKFIIFNGRNMGDDIPNPFHFTERIWNPVEHSLALSG